MVKLYSFLYMLFHEPLLTIVLLQSGAKWLKWPRWKFLYCAVKKVRNHGIVLEIGGGLSTLVISKSIINSKGIVRTVELSEFWKQFIKSRLIRDNVEFYNEPNFAGVDLVFIDTDFVLSNPERYRVIVDNRESLCREMHLPFYANIKIGTNIVLTGF